MTQQPLVPAAARRGQLIGVIALSVVAALVPVAALVVSAYRSPIPFALALVLQAFALVWLARIAWSWRRHQRSARPADFVLVAGLLMTGVLALVLVRELARSAGILGSALPRVLGGQPFAADSRTSVPRRWWWPGWPLRPSSSCS